MDPIMEQEKRLWEYIDGISDSSERAAIEKLISDSAEWKAKYHELLEIHQLVTETELEQPSLRFTKNVMEEIARYKIAPAAKEYINKKIIWGIASFFIVALLGFLVYGFSQVDWSEAESGNLIGIDFSKVDYSIMFDNTYMNMFMMLNVVLALFLFDKILENRKKQYIDQQR